MDKRRIGYILGFGAVIVTVALIAVAFISSPDRSNNHDDSNSDNHHSSNEPQSTAPLEDLTSQNTVNIDIEDFAYSKANIKIKKGTKVIWTNRDTMEHNVMMDHQDSGSPHDAPSPDEVKSDVLAGPLLAKGESYSFTFNEVSTAPYHCSPHPYMKGSVTVVE